MDVDFVFKVAGIGILTSVVSQVLTRAGREDIATLATLSGLVVVLMMVVQEIDALFQSIKSIFGL